MLHLGLTSRNYSDLFFQKVSAGHLGKKDVAIGFSISGETQAVIDSLAAAKQAGAVTVAVTGGQTSELARSRITFSLRPRSIFRRSADGSHPESLRWLLWTLCGAIMLSDPNGLTGC